MNMEYIKGISLELCFKFKCSVLSMLSTFLVQQLDKQPYLQSEHICPLSKCNTFD